MEPISTTVLCAGLVQLGKAALEGAAGKVGDAAMAAAGQYWVKAKSLLGLTSDPPPEKLDAEIGKAVYNQPEIQDQLRELLKEHDKAAASLVGSIHVNNGMVNVIEKNTGSINVNQNFH
jgi:hypothetical protein